MRRLLTIATVALASAVALAMLALAGPAYANEVNVTETIGGPEVVVYAEDIEAQPVLVVRQDAVALNKSGLYVSSAY